MMTVEDLRNVTLVKWLPRTFFYMENYDIAMTALRYWERLWVSSWTTILAVFAQIVSCTFVAYGLARIKFKGSGILFALVLFTLIIPPQVTIAPTFLMFSPNSPFGSAFDLTNTFWPVILPAFFSLGLNGGLFVFIYRQYYRSMPAELENAALIDGCGVFKAYWKIILPNAKSPILVCMILSLVWQWNNYFEPSIFIQDIVNHGNLPMQLSILDSGPGAAMAVAEVSGAEMAATFLVILPIILVFFVLQNQFMKGIERVGLAN